MAMLLINWTVIRRMKIHDVIVYAVFLLYMIMLIEVAYMPILRTISFVSMGVEMSVRIDKINIIPLNGILFNASGFGDAAKEVLRNILMLFPLGMLLPMIHSRFEKMRTMAWYASVISITKELIDFVCQISGSCADINDYILNVFGSMLGYACYEQIYKKGRKSCMNKIG